MTSPTTRSLEATESFDVSNDASVDKLHAKAIGLIGVLFLTVTGAAPESAMLGNVLGTNALCWIGAAAGLFVGAKL